MVRVKSRGRATNLVSDFRTRAGVRAWMSHDCLGLGVGLTLTLTLTLTLIIHIPYPFYPHHNPTSWVSR